MSIESMKLIANIASGSTTANSLQHIAKIANQAIEQAQKQEPVAWMTIDSNGEEDDIWYENPEGKLLEGWTYIPLYTSPPQPPQSVARGLSQEAAPRKPLTDEEVEKIIKQNMSLQMNLAGIRADFEAAHGITGEKE